jgi:hypothetical protein
MDKLTGRSMKNCAVVLTFFALAGAFRPAAVSGKGLIEETKSDVNLTVYTGLGVYVSDAKNEKEETAAPQIAVHNHAEATNLRLQVDGIFENLEQTVGLDFKLRLSDNGSLGWVDKMQGYLKFSPLGSTITLWAGDLDNNTFESNGALDSDYSDGIGLHVIAAPFEGLDIGLGVFPNVFGTVNSESVSTIWIESDSRLRKPGIMGIDLMNAQYTFQAAYTLPGWTRVTAGFATSETASNLGTLIGYRPYETYSITRANALDDYSFMASIAVLVLEGWGVSTIFDMHYLMLSYYVDNEGAEYPTFEDVLKSRLWLGQKLNWSLGPLSLWITAREAFLEGTVTEEVWPSGEQLYTPVLALDGRLSWDVNETFTPWAAAGYLSGGYLYDAMRPTKWEYDTLSGGAFNKNYSAWYIHPGITVNLGGAGIIDAGFGMYGRDDKAGFLDGVESLIYGVAIDYRITF